jgi:hypothetical protein
MIEFTDHKWLVRNKLQQQRTADNKILFYQQPMPTVTIAITSSDPVTFNRTEIELSTRDQQTYIASITSSVPTARGTN